MLRVYQSFTQSLPYVRRASINVSLGRLSPKYFAFPVTSSKKLESVDEEKILAKNILVSTQYC